jgi:hypothetical protein
MEVTDKGAPYSTTHVKNQTLSAPRNPLAA